MKNSADLFPVAFATQEYRTARPEVPSGEQQGYRSKRVFWLERLRTVISRHQQLLCGDEITSLGQS